MEHLEPPSCTAFSFSFLSSLYIVARAHTPVLCTPFTPFALRVFYFHYGWRHRFFKVVCPFPGPSFATGKAGSGNPPRFDADIRNKQRYRDALRTWMKTMIQFAEFYKKVKNMVHGSSYMIFLACNSLEQDLIRQDQLDGRVSLQRGELDVDRSYYYSTSSM